VPFDLGNWLGPFTLFGPLVFGVTLALLILWAALPFAIFGTKSRLNHLIALLERVASRDGVAAAKGDGGGALGNLFQKLRHELLQSDTHLVEEALKPGEVDLLLGGKGQRKVAGVRVAADVVEVSLNLSDLASPTSAQSPDDLRECVAGAFVGRPGLRVLFSPDLAQLIIQVRPEANVGEVRDLLRSHVFGFHPLDKAP
jgi:hypothetical protein